MTKGVIMETKNILKDIGKRCDGDIYLGVVGPVRSGKSSFIKRFMEMTVIPYIEDEDAKMRAIDELPQSGKGRMIMTVEPKFIPNQAVSMALEDSFNVHVRLVDCVGYVIEGAKGYKDEQGVRYVKTPWYLESIPFDKAAKIGTKKVIQDHSTIGIVVTCDGSISDIEKGNYVDATDSIIEELQEIGKPFIVIVNTTNVNSADCKVTVDRLLEKYQVPVIAMDVTTMEEEQITDLLKQALYEFSISEVRIEVPKWLAMLSNNHWLKQTLDTSLQESMRAIKKFKDVENIATTISEYDFVDKAYLSGIDTASSSATLKIEEKRGLYNEVLEEIIGDKGFDQASFLNFIQELVDIKKEYTGFSSAIRMVKQTGYGYAIPKLDDIELSEPVIIKQGPRYGMKLISKAGTTYMIKIDIESTFEPIIGSKEQAEAFIEYLKSNGDDKQAIFNCDVFGRKLGDLIEEGMYFKLNSIPENASIRLHDILSKIVNKGKSNVIAIVL